MNPSLRLGFPSIGGEKPGGKSAVNDSSLHRWILEHRRQLPWYDQPGPIYLNTAGMALRSRLLLDRLALRAGNPLSSSQILEKARHAAAAWVGSPPQDVVPVMGTHCAFERLFVLQENRPGDYLVDPCCHQAVMAPLRRLEKLGIARIRLLPVEPDGTLDLVGIRSLLTAETRSLVITHVSSVTGTIQPLRALQRLLASFPFPAGKSPLLVVDGAQSAPRLPVALPGVDVWVMAHQKLGALEGASVVLSSRAPSLLAENTDGEEARQQVWACLAAGTPHATAMGSLCDALEFLSSLEIPGEPPRRGASAVHVLLHRLMEPFQARLSSLKGMRRYGPVGERGNHNAGILSFNIEGMTPSEVGGALEAAGILVRAGTPDAAGHCFCVPELARALPDLDRFGGAVRISLGWHTLPEELDRVASVLEGLVSR